MLFDRLEERAALDRLLAGMRRGRSSTLVLTGEPGIGKTALLEYAADAAAPFARVLRVTGVESEMGLAFAGLHQLLLPLLPQLDELPPPQRRALGTALGLIDGPAPDRFLVGLAVLTMLAAASNEQPLLVLVDDAHWLDEETAHVVAFVLRRLDAEGIGVVLSTKDDSQRAGPYAELPTLEIVGLDDVAARELLESTATGRIEEAILRRIVQASGGNPLALVELSGELSADQLAGGGLLPDPLPIGRQLTDRFRRLVTSLPSETQRLLLIAAADPTGDPNVLWCAARELGLESTAAAPAEAQRLVHLTPVVTFRHPLIRSAVYAGAPPVERRRVHAALATATDPADADRRAWHAALATVGTDERVADELDDAAQRARVRGGYAAVGSLLARAGALTPDPGRRAERLLAAAEAELTRGAPMRAAELEAAAEPGLPTPLGRARALRLKGAIAHALGDPTAAVASLVPAAQALESIDGQLARETLLEALRNAVISSAPGSEEQAHEIARAAVRSIGASTDEPTVADSLLEGFAARMLGPAATAAPPLRRAVELLRDGPIADDVRLRGLGAGWVAASELFEEGARDALARQWVALARKHGALARLSQALTVLGISEAWAGRLSASDACFAERRDIDDAIGFSGMAGQTSPHQIIVLGWRGLEREARTLAESAMRDADERHQRENVDFCRYALSVLEISLGRYEAALEHARAVFEHDPLYVGVRALPELVEAAVRAGEQTLAAAAIQRATERFLASGTPWALGLLARCKAQVAEGDAAETLYREAIEKLQGRLLVPELTRAHLLYGEWLRRSRRYRDARNELQMAADTFERIGGELFAERARRELAATGARARKRADPTRSDLTPQEAHVASLAARGSTNAEIAAQLFISSSTVEYHLRKVFRKLGIRSRTQLARLHFESEQNEG